MRRALVLYALGAMAACHDAEQDTTPPLTQTRANTLVDVTFEVAELISLEQPHGDNPAPMELTVDKDFVCPGGGTGHIGGEGHYTPEPGKAFGPTVFEITVMLADCAFNMGALSSTSLTALGTVEAGQPITNLTFMGEVSWSPATDTCQATLKLFGTNYDDFIGTVCAAQITPDSIDLLPP
jgi:hypothetical protein